MNFVSSRWILPEVRIQHLKETFVARGFKSFKNVKTSAGEHFLQERIDQIMPGLSELQEFFSLVLIGQSASNLPAFKFSIALCGEIG